MSSAGILQKVLLVTDACNLEISCGTIELCRNVLGGTLDFKEFHEAEKWLRSFNSGDLLGLTQLEGGTWRDSAHFNNSVSESEDQVLESTQPLCHICLVLSKFTEDSVKSTSYLSKLRFRVLINGSVADLCFITSYHSAAWHPIGYFANGDSLDLVNSLMIWELAPVEML
jgi:hypothetical protein